MEDENKAQKAFELDKSIKEDELKRRMLFISNIQKLIQMYNEDLYKFILGEGVEPKWSAYLADIEKFYSRTKVERWRRIVNRLLKEFEIDVNSIIYIPETRLEEIVRVSKTKEEAEALIMQAKVLTTLDFKNLLREKRGKPTTDECQHNLVTYDICSKCGFKTKK